MVTYAQLWEDNYFLKKIKENNFLVHMHVFLTVGEVLKK